MANVIDPFSSFVPVIGSFAILLDIVFLFVEALYAIFAFILVRQVGVLTHSFKTEMAGMLKLFAWIHLFVALGLVVISVLSL